MQRSLTVLLPVKNAQDTLIESVADILDMATDTDRRFELLIIDDCSADATDEVAHEITRHYPQVRLIRHEAPLGHAEAIQTGLKHSRGQLAVVCEGWPIRFRMIEQPAREPAHAHSRPAEPNFLRRLKTFALGE